MYKVTIVKNGEIMRIDYISDDDVIERFARVAIFNHAGLNYRLEHHYDELLEGRTWYDLTFTVNNDTIFHRYIRVEEV